MEPKSQLTALTKRVKELEKDGMPPKMIEAMKNRIEALKEKHPEVTKKRKPRKKTSKK